MEVSIIVDENDKIINYKERSHLGKEDIYRVACLLIRNSEGKFLLAQRGFSKRNNPGAWSFSVAGTVERGESYDKNIVKETEEEIGIKNLGMRKVFKKKITGKYNFFCQFYMAEMNVDLDAFTKEANEIEELKWFSSSQIKQGTYRGYPFSKTLIKYLDDFEIL